MWDCVGRDETEGKKGSNHGAVMCSFHLHFVNMPGFHLIRETWEDLALVWARNAGSWQQSRSENECENRMDLRALWDMQSAGLC